MINTFASALQGLGQLNTVILLLALVVLFVVAFKVLEMVMQTFLVSALSGGFYLALSYYLDPVKFSLDSLLFFTLIGGSLYTGYSLLSTSASLLKMLFKIPFKIFEKIKSLLDRN